MMGIDLFIVRIRSLVFSAAMAGIAGGLFAHYVSFIQPAMFTANLSTQLTASVVAGGMGSITGPVIAAIIFVAIPEALRVASIWRLVAYGFFTSCYYGISTTGHFWTSGAVLDVYQKSIS